MSLPVLGDVCLMEGGDYCATAAGSTPSNGRESPLALSLTMGYYCIVLACSIEADLVESIIDRSPLPHNKPCKLHARMGHI